MEIIESLTCCCQLIYAPVEFSAPRLNRVNINCCHVQVNMLFYILQMNTENIYACGWPYRPALKHFCFFLFGVALETTQPRVHMKKRKSTGSSECLTYTHQKYICYIDLYYRQKIYMYRQRKTTKDLYLHRVTCKSPVFVLVSCQSDCNKSHEELFLCPERNDRTEQRPER